MYASEKKLVHYNLYDTSDNFSLNSSSKTNHCLMFCQFLTNLAQYFCGVVLFFWVHSLECWRLTFWLFAHRSHVIGETDRVPDIKSRLTMCKQRAFDTVQLLWSTNFLLVVISIWNWQEFYLYGVPLLKNFQLFASIKCIFCENNMHFILNIGIESNSSGHTYFEQLDF